MRDRGRLTQQSVKAAVDIVESREIAFRQQGTLTHQSRIKACHKAFSVGQGANCLQGFKLNRTPQKLRLACQPKACRAEDRCMLGKNLDEGFILQLEQRIADRRGAESEQGLQFLT